MDQEKIIKLFSFISEKYDCVDRLLSFGRDRYWRRCLVDEANSCSATKILDICTGTGEVVKEFGTRGIGREIVGLDLSEEMLDIARKKITRKNLASRIKFLKADAQDLPFPSETFDLVSMAFGLRNISEPRRAIEEMNRVLKKGGKALILEFTLPPNALLRELYLLYLKTAAPFLGKVIVGSKTPYNYLVSSISSFYKESNVLKLLKSASLEDINRQSLTGGIVTLYKGKR